MSESGVIPRHIPREVGRTFDVDDIVITVLVERGLVRLEVGSSIVLLDMDGTEELAQLIVRACWEASMPP